jgi:hypothetical protein
MNPEWIHDGLYLLVMLGGVATIIATLRANQDATTKSLGEIKGTLTDQGARLGHLETKVAVLTDRDDRGDSRPTGAGSPRR